MQRTGKSIKLVKKGKRPQATGLMDTPLTLRQVAGAAQKALSVAGQVASYFNTELKMLDTTATATPTSGTSTVVPLTLMAQGSDYNQRDGISIKLMDLDVRVYAARNIASATSSDFIRFLIVQDTENHGATPAVADILESDGVLAPLLHYSGNRWRMIADEAFALEPVQPGVCSKFNKKLQTHVTYKGTGATAADGWEGQLYAVFMSSTATNNPTYSYFIRASFVDN